MSAQDGRHRRARRAAVAIAGLAVAVPLTAAASPAHASPAWQVADVIPVAVGAEAVAEDMSTRTVWVANYDDNTVTAISERTRRVTAVIPVGADPDAVAADPRRGLVYVVNGGSDYGSAGDAGTVSVVSERLRRVVATITVGPSPDGVAVDQRTGMAYVSDGNFGAPGTIGGPADGFVSAVSERSRKVTATFTAGPGGPVSIAADGGSLYVPYFGGDYGGAVAVLDERTGAVTGGFGAGFREGGVVADPRSRTVWVTSVSDNGGYDPTVTGFSAATGKAVASVPVPGSGAPLAVDPRAGNVYVAGFGGGGGSVSVIGEKAGAVTATIPLSTPANGMAVDPCTGAVWVSDGNAGTVSVISRG